MLQQSYIRLWFLFEIVDFGGNMIEIWCEYMICEARVFHFTVEVEISSLY